MAQTAEMQEVENYVEHIRHLSDEREALIQELETENDSLKQEIEQLKQEQNGLCLKYFQFNILQWTEKKI